ncbi:hypothetical protein TNCV_914991 [Trichonephila clavipes]|uniref:inositol-phosphate phosphatase n=1 Tax=Trichonephila clavipes TaxID=2585209 RepID=A0A8X6RF60_TRICX|nr:hypothetical protein TNCV_914991 [Trichonephila clavipes]
MATGSYMTPIYSRSQSEVLGDLHKCNTATDDASLVDMRGYKFLQLTEGRADLFMHLYSIKKWKVCAGNALVDALDGQMTTTYEEDVNYGDPSDVTISDGIVASIVDKDIPFYFINDMEYINAL